MADVVAIGLRALAYAAALLAAGTPIFLWALDDVLHRASRAIRATTLPLAAVGLVLTLAHAGIEPVRLAGDWSGVFDGSLQGILWQSSFGTTTAIRLFGLGVIAAAWVRPGRLTGGLGLIGATLVVASFAFMGHTAADPRRWLMAPLLILHLLAVAFWFGSLRPLLAVTRHEDAPTAAAAIARFSAIAIRIVPVLFLAGVVMAALLLTSLADLGTPYGISLLGKLGGFALLMLFAAWNKLRLGPRIADGERSAVEAFRRSVLAEWWLILAVVAITAVMTALFSPAH